ncbi:MAG: alcohol acetyltransferase, partial [Bacteroidetes bacterium]|nr:alcohol acetyltransferase [Bacteroidota bacterium]
MGNNANNASDSKEWYRLDNAAKIFPAVTNKTRTSVYRITIKLSEAVKIKELQEALEQTLIQLPYFRSELKKGFFWYWLEPSTSNPRVQLDQG